VENAPLIFPIGVRAPAAMCEEIMP
jgi:hypothetical protein